MPRFNTHKAFQDYLATRGRMILIYSGSVFALSALLVLYVWQYVQMVEIQMQTFDVRKQHQLLEEDIERLTMQKESLLSLDRVEQFASTRLGMVPASRENVRFLTHKGILHAPGMTPKRPTPLPSSSSTPSAFQAPPSIPWPSDPIPLIPTGGSLEPQPLEGQISDDELNRILYSYDPNPARQASPAVSPPAGLATGEEPPQLDSAPGPPVPDPIGDLLQKHGSMEGQ